MIGKHKQFLSTKQLIVGRQPLVEALEAGEALDKILMARNATGEILAQIKQLARQHQVPIQLVPQEKINGITNTNHQGVLAFRSAVQYFALQDIIDHVNSDGKVPLFLLLDGITDVRNIGAIARSALCCGAHAIVLPQRGVAAINEDAIKASAGALQKMHICRVPELKDAIHTLQLNGIAILGSEMTAEKMLHQTELTAPVAIVMGSEDTGLSKDVAEACNGIFAIPMTGDFESLNVSVAAGMILYEAQRQRIMAG